MTGKVSVASSMDLNRRIGRQRRKHNLRRHLNAHRQAAWNKYGPDAFVFEIIETVGPECLLNAEQRHIDSHKAADRNCGFNIRMKAESNVGLPVSKETRARISAA